MGKLGASFFIYFIFCSALAFWDFDWNAEDPKGSIRKQTFYMTLEQKRAYIADLDVIESAGAFGGHRGNFVHGKDVPEIHDLANDIREKRNKPRVNWPSKGFWKSIGDFFWKPATLFLDRS
ncbi:hypothetical protein [Comamonas terrae]|uniref:Uncharacterized protein n=2 Tax=Comamonas terrae TaxID=673548 RepID=A0ABW5UK00_9BURK|nr:hypothetical protein [Comamonas terrae]